MIRVRAPHALGQDMRKTNSILKRTLKVSSLPLFFTISISFIAWYFLLRFTEEKPYSELPCFFNEKAHFVPLKINGFSSANIPQIEVQIEDSIILTKVDLGWEGGIALPQDILNTLNNKSFIKKHSFFSIRGRTYESDIYELPKIQIGKMDIFPMWAEEYNQESIADASLKRNNKILENHLGKMGWHVFRPFNLFLDCDHSLMIIVDSLETLKQQGYPVDTFIEAPLLLDRGSIDFEAITEAGPLRCVLDTGSTWNLLNKNLENTDQNHRLIDLQHLDERPSDFNPNNEDLLVFNSESCWKTQTFRVGDKEFGPVNFVQLKSPLGLDAVIGMEFIDTHLIFIDFHNKKIYFSELPEQQSLFTRTYNLIKNKIKATDSNKGS